MSTERNAKPKEEVQMVPRGRTTMWKLAALTGLVALAACSADTAESVEQAPAEFEGDETHSAAQDGVVVVTHELEDGTTQVQIWNDAQTELLFELEYVPSGPQYSFRHLLNGAMGAYPLEPGAPKPGRELLHDQAMMLFGLMGGRGGEQAYDARGCDGASSPLECTSVGGCCDEHDHCYYQKNCTQNSWGCSPSSCATVWGGLWGLVTAPVLCAVGGAVAATCSSADNSTECRDCNAEVLDCMLNPFREKPGESSCCEDKKTNPDACKEERPEGCVVLPDGTCKPADDPLPEEPPKPPESEPPNGAPGGDTPCSQGTGCSSHPPGPVDNPWPGGCHTGGTTTSLSPEEKFGPAPDGEAVAGDIPWSYQIDFWNSADALAAVQELVVVDYLDPSFDWTTVDFGFVEYGDRIVSVDEGVTTFLTRDYPAVDGCVMTGTAEGQLALDIELSYNAQTGRIELRMRVIDTATGTWPMDPYAGILPPPDEEVCGRGSLTFTVRPLASLEPGTILRNTASVIFDTNPANNTNEVWNVIAE